MIIYLDESGDLGFNFTRPYRKGGSSRYLSIAFLRVPRDSKHLTKRIVRALYKKRKGPRPKEIKGAEISAAEQKDFAGQVVRFLKSNPSARVFAITVDKRNVKHHIREDANKLYNYMISLILLDKIKNSKIVSFIPDPRTIKVRSGNSLVDYLQTKLWFELNSKTKLIHQAEESHNALNLQFADIIAHLVWKHYENKDASEAFQILQKKVELRELFFHGGN
ncbi:MAG: DUF3800 domain-containing protein [Desulfobacterales bacterium]|nr:DUF3800 domain-containing protein [Desulfobacterales bacterium]